MSSSPLKAIKIPLPGSMQREHMVNPFRATSPTPGFPPPREKKKREELPPMPPKDLLLSSLLNDTKAEALRRIANIYKEMTDEGKSTEYISEFYITLYNLAKLRTTDLLVKEKELFRKYVALNRAEAKVLFDDETGMCN